MLSEEEAQVENFTNTKEIFVSVYKRVKKWTREEDQLLLTLVGKYNNSKWNKIAKAFDNRTASQCYERHRKIKPELKKGPWTLEEDEALIELINVYGKKWSKISRIMKSRTGKQIRDRYMNNLDQKYNKGRFSDDEEKLISELLAKFGPIWSLIALHFPDRNSQIIKNRFYSRFYSKSFTFDENCTEEELLNKLKEILF
jgi:hypothetical protein